MSKKLKEGESEWDAKKLIITGYLFSYPRQYLFDPDPDILSLFSNFEIYSSDEVWFTVDNGQVTIQDI